MNKHLLTSAAVCCICIIAGCDKIITLPSRTPAQSEPASFDRNSSFQKTVSTKERTMKEHKSGTWTPGLSEEEKATLFAIAKDTLKRCVNNETKPFPIDSYTITPKLRIDTATFVTLKISSQLRGCIGSLAPEEPLYMSVHHNAVNAAMHDPRFRQVQPSELAQIDIDVSVLSPIKSIQKIDDFKLGQQGIILEKGMHRAVFLPEVAIEQGWTKDETLTHLSMKAGMSPDAWREDTNFKVFESVVLSLEDSQK